MKLKNIFLIFIFFLLIYPGYCYAGIEYQYWYNKSMTTIVSTYYSAGINQKYSKGHCALLVLTSAGSLAITFELSDDDINYYVPYDSNGNALNSIATTLIANRWIIFVPQLANYIRFKFVLTDSNSTVSATYKQME